MKLANRGEPSGAVMDKSDNDWRAESDLRTLIEASKIKKDPARYKAALKERDKQRKHLSGIRSMRPTS